MTLVVKDNVKDLRFRIFLSFWGVIVLICGNKTHMCHWISNKLLIWGGGDGFNYILYALIYLPFQVKPYSWKNFSYQQYLNHQHPLLWHHLLFTSQWQISFYAACAYENVSHMSIWQCDIAWLIQGKLNSEKSNVLCSLLHVIASGLTCSWIF